MADYYKTLGVERTSSESEIKSAYRKLALKFHPDRNQGSKEAENKFKEISEAYAVLSDKQKKAQYDQFGSSDFHQRYSSEDIFRGTDFGSVFNEFGFGGNFEDIFGNIFGMSGDPRGHGRGGGRQRGQQPPPRGQDVEYPLQISFMDAYRGCEKQISFRLSDGTQRELSVKVPAGIAEGAKLRVQGRGAPSPYGGPAGDLYVIVTTIPQADFQRVGNDIEAPIVLKISEAVLGCSKDLTTPSGSKTVKVPSGVTAGTKIRLKGLGFPEPGGKKQSGDLYAVVKIEIPKNLSSQQQEAMTVLQDLGL